MGVFSNHLQFCAGIMQISFGTASQNSLDKSFNRANAVMASGNLASDASASIREEYLQRQAQKAAIKGIIESLSQEAQQKCDRCKQQVAVLGEKRTELAAKKGDRYADVDSSREKLSELEAKYLGNIASRNASLSDIADLQNEVNRLAERKRRAENKEREFKKWCWVPGYNIYLAVDYLTNDEVQRLNSISQNLKRQALELKYNVTETKKLETMLAQGKSEQRTLASKIAELEKEIGSIIAQLNELNRELLQWMELQCYYSDLQAQLESDKTDPEIIRQQLVNLPNELEKIA